MNTPPKFGIGGVGSRAFISQHEMGVQYHRDDGAAMGFGPKDVQLTQQSLDHILVGHIDARGMAHGGHTMRTLRRWQREGKNVENLIIFPEEWSDHQITTSIQRVIDSPDRVLDYGPRVQLEGTIDGVVVRVYLKLPDKGPVVVSAAPQRGPGVKRVRSGRICDVW